MRTTHLRLVAHIPTSIGELILYAKTLRQKLTNNPHLQNPPLALTQFDADIAGLEAAEAATRTTKDMTRPRNKKAQAVIHDIHVYEAYAQIVIDANPALAPEVMASTGFAESLHHLGAHAPISAKMGPDLIVILRAHAGAHGSVYEWQWSGDQKTWNSAPATSHAHTTIPDLPVGTTQWFRVRINKGDVVGDWSDPVSLIVH